MKAFLNNFNEIKIKDIKNISTSEFELFDSLNNLLDFTVTNHANFIILTTKNTLDPNKDYFLLYNNTKYPIYLGDITLESSFDTKYKYDSLDLGASYTPSCTLFKLWSPVIKELYLILNINNLEKTYKVESYKNGVWEICINENIENALYKYRFRIDDIFIETIDPYTLGIQKDYEYGVVINKNKFIKEKENISFSGNPLESVIYEAHIRDLTSLLNTPAKSTFEGITKNKIVNGHLSSLGITHIQVLPINSYVVTTNDKCEYNWGYNPYTFLSLFPKYSTNPNNPEAVINEFIDFVNNMHASNIGVIVDIVPNHVYKLSSNPLNLLVPKYYFQYDHNGLHTDFSYCGNDLNSTKSMTKNLFIQTIKHYIDFYNIDGFRVDIMGILDYNTINTLALEGKKIKPNLLLYGEGWDMGTTFGHSKTAIIKNEYHTKAGFFNDYYREKLSDILLKRGSSLDLENMLNGSANIFSTKEKSVNYFTCHDGLTLFDKIYLSKTKTRTVKDNIIIVFSILLTSFGITFINGGDEFLRTKYGAFNSYNAGDEINGFDYSLLDKNNYSLNLVKELLKLRKKLKFLKDKDINFESIDDFVYKVKYNTKEYILYYNMTYQSKEFIFSKDTFYIFNGKINIYEQINSITISNIGVHVFERNLK
ncbi:MAG: hypothetical protein LBV51_04380 [Acholeplasmatales bacterium]|jgi:pullulanase|nr:hypothetical protein [Acholeplasmatales bacterium]